ncbi:MAG TPA: hypothetical protein VFZ23_17410 [Pyrinomonadaceae bacterium]
MLVKIFWSLCGIFMLVAALLFLTGTLSMFNAVVLGFIAFGLTFMGMIAVLPFMVTHPAPPKKPAKTMAVANQAVETSAKGYGVLKSA